MYNNCFYELFDKDEYTDFIKKIDKMFRTSPEYGIWLHSRVDREMCAATGMSKDNDGIDIEVHHYNVTLWNWTEIILDYFMGTEPIIPVNAHYICLILSDIHLSNCVPYIPLTHCIHKMLHAIGEDLVFAKYPDIINHIYIGDVERAHDIIRYHVKNLKIILEKENE